MTEKLLKRKITDCIEFEISDLDMPLDEIIEEVHREYPNYQFDRTETRYKSCLIAVFEKHY